MGDMDKELQGCQVVIGMFILAILAAGIIIGALIAVVINFVL